MTVLHLVLDTTALRSDPARKKDAFKSLARLAQARVVQVYIPYIVQQEFLSQEKEQYHEHLQKVVSSIENLYRKSLPDEMKLCLESNIRDFKKFQSEINEFSRQMFEKWCNETHTKILPIHVSHGQKVIDSYFRGDAPFKKKKSREDFPDAFIWQVISDLSETLEKLYVVTEDNEVNSALQTETKIIPFKSLDDFITSEPYQKILKELDFEESKQFNREGNLRKLLMLLKSDKTILYSIEAELFKEFQGKTIKSLDIPSDNHRATIDSLGNIQELNFHMERLSYYSSSVFVIPFSSKMETQLSYLVFEADYLDDEQKSQIPISEWDNYIQCAYEDYLLVVEGRITITLDLKNVERPNLSNKGLEKIIQNARIHIHTIDKISFIS